MQAFFSWWGRELSWFIPDVLKERGVSSSRLLWLEFVDAEARFSRIVGGKLVSLGSVALCDTDPGMEKIALDTLFSKIGTKAVGIVVSDEQVLRKELKLPLQARADLEQVIRFEMDRQTPYRAEQVFFHQREVGLEAGQIRANLVILPRHAIDRALARVRQWGLELHAIAVSQQLLGGRDWENLLPTTLRPAVGRFWYWIYGVLGGIAVLLCAALLALPLWQKQELLAKVSDVALKAEREAKAVTALKESLAAANGRYNFLIERKLATVPMVALLEEVSRLLPDNTWIQQLEVRGNEMMLRGETGASSRLVALFAQSEVLGEANHKSPLVKMTNNLERFDLAVAVRPTAYDLSLAQQSDRVVAQVGRSGDGANRLGGFKK